LRASGFCAKSGPSVDRILFRKRFLTEEATLKITQSLLLASAMFLLAGMEGAIAQLNPPCLLVCFPPGKFNAQKCTCTSSQDNSRVCGLVCLGPDETLDANKCRCVKSRRPS
jgi:hypothetical protein